MLFLGGKNVHVRGLHFWNLLASISRLLHLLLSQPTGEKSSCPSTNILPGLLQISAFFLFSNFRKGRLLYIRPVGWLVGRLVGCLVGRRHN